ncbi:MAG: secondary thiamine-phosphate synthase enzyme YjbQ [Candidatus Cyclobacteriaceae bacterium M3_2C_046]
MKIEIQTRFIEFNTKGNTHIIDLTDKIRKELHQSGFNEGNVTVFGIGSTTGISTVEFEPGLVQHDINDMFQKIAPYGVSYEHNNTWNDDNGASHLRSTLMGSSLNVPFTSGELILGTWQQIIFIDFDTRPRSRKVVVQFIGSKNDQG